MSGWAAPALAAELRALRAVLAVADAGSTAAAGAHLHLSQPAVARAVQRVESHLGLPLFERVARGMRANAAGQALAARVRQALAELAGEGDGPPASPRLASLGTPAQFGVLLALADAASGRRVAQQLGVSQPAVQQAVRQIEHAWGAALFERTRTGLVPNAAGRLALARAKRALAELRGAEEDLQALAGAVRGRVVVGTLPYWGGSFLPRALGRLAERHPGISITVVDGTYDSLLAQLRQADIDLLVGALREVPPPGPLLQSPLLDDPLAAVVRAGHPLVGRAPTRLRQLRGAQWILAMPGAPARRMLEQAFAHEGLPPPQGGVQVNSPALLQSMLLEGDGVALMSPRQLEREIAAGLLHVLPVRVPQSRRSIGLVMRSAFEPPAPLRELIDSLREASAQAAEASAAATRR